jgi:hypothetical protein
LGQEIPCVVRFGGKRATGKALLESTEILFRGDFRLKIPVKDIKEIKAADGELRVKTAEGLAVFELGARAEKWLDKILNPKSVIEKLGVKLGEAVSLHGTFDRKFHETLKKHGAKISAANGAPWSFFAAETRAELAKVKAVAMSLQGAAALWLIYPKGQKTITESDVREAGLKAGLTDVKVASFSQTHTALKFVIPKDKR